MSLLEDAIEFWVVSSHLDFLAPPTEMHRIDLSTRLLWLLFSGFPQLVPVSSTSNTPKSHFLSRPDIIAPDLDISILNPSKVSPGYWFLTVADPWEQPGPYIYDDLGNLVWSGYDETAGRLVTDLKVIEYQGRISLSFFRGNRHDMHAVGNGIIMDNNYQITSMMNPASVGVVPDEHEFNVLGDGSTVLITSYRPQRYDLASFNLTNGIGWILDSLFYEIDLQTKQILFQWSALEHVDPAGSQFPLSAVAGTGLTPETAWDYFHINSVEKMADEDYLISSRHMSSLYKISKRDGSVVWQVGGAHSSFELESSLVFSFQHHARIITENVTTVIISLFDNASGSWPHTLHSAPYSSGLLLALENSSSPMTATLVGKFDNPDKQSAIAKGSMQTLPNGNLFIGWGQAGTFSEFTSDGELVMHAKFRTTAAASYRAYKYSFNATPEDRPTLWTYSLGLNSPVTSYVSWNGATEVRYWNFYSCESATGDCVILGRETKKGFETVHVSLRNHNWMIAEALAIDGSSLGNSTTVATFIPSELLRANCGLRECSIPRIEVERNKQVNWPQVLPRPRAREYDMVWLYLVLAYCTGAGSLLFWPQIWALFSRLPLMIYAAIHR